MPVTGDGNFPLASPWLGRGRGRGSLLYKTTALRDGINAQPLIWNDWFFDAIPGGTTSTITSATLAFTGRAVAVNAKRNVVVTVGAISITARAVVVNAKTNRAVSLASISLAGQSVIVNAKRNVAAVAQSMAYAGQAVVSRNTGPTIISVVAAVLANVALALVTNAKTVTTQFTAFVLYIGKQLIGAGAEISAGVRRIHLAIRIGL